MIAEVGHFALVLALAFALVQSVVPLIGAHRAEPGLMRFADMSALIQFGLATRRVIAAPSRL